MNKLLIKITRWCNEYIFIAFCYTNQCSHVHCRIYNTSLTDIFDMDILQHMAMFELTSGTGIVIQIIPILSILCLSSIDPSQYILTNIGEEKKLNEF